ncbi:MAG: site-specific integrase [Clostridiales bacterium]|nr:site-specific integrase [Clostridiales bacterium]
MNNKQQPTPVYFNEDDGQWHFNKKVLTSKMEIQYVRDKHGFDGPEEAMEAYLAYNRIFKEKIAKISQQKAPDSSLLTDMERWFHKEFVPTRSSATVTGSSYVLYRFIIPNLGSLADKPLAHVTTSDINDLIKQTDGFCSTSKAQVYKFLNAYFSDAYAEHKIRDNIMAPISPDYPSDQRKERVIYNPDQLVRFLKGARKTGHFFEFYLALLGLRTGEIRGIAPQDFSEETGTLSIRRQIVRANEPAYAVDENMLLESNGIECKPPKSEASMRVIEVPPITFDLLRERETELCWMQKAYESKEGRKWDPALAQFLCLSYQGTFKSTNTLNASLKRICSSLGLPVISMHGLRHMTATYLFAYGLDEGSTSDEALERVSHYLGHSSVNITFDVYVHYMKEISRIRDVLDNTADPFLQFSGEWRVCAG